MQPVGFIGSDGMPVLRELDLKALDILACSGLRLLYASEHRPLFNAPVETRLAYTQLVEAGMLEPVTGKTIDKVIGAVHALLEKTGGRRE